MWGKELIQCTSLQDDTFNVPHNTSWMEEMMKLDIPYYCIDPGRDVAYVASLEARLLLPSRTLAYGLPPTGCQSYFHMNTYQCYDE
jgi:hypothetical protein